MDNFQLTGQFGLILIAENSFPELKLPEQRIGCLRSAYDHLRLDGKFLLTVRRFDPTGYANGRRETPWSEPLAHPVTGDLVRRMVRFRLDEDRRYVCGEMLYETLKGDGGKEVEEFPFKFPVMLEDDYKSLFAEAGFAPTCFGGYEGRPPNEGDEYLCFVGKKTKF